MALFGRAVVLAVWVCASAGATDWPQFLGPNRDCTTPDEAPSCDPGGWTVKWRKSLASVPASGSFSSVAVAQGKIVFLTMDGCEARDASTGEMLWLSRTNSGKGHCTPSVCANRVYVYDARENLCCLDLADGSPVWVQAVSNYVTAPRPLSDNSLSPLVADGKVFVFGAGQTNCALAFNATNGALLWKGHSAPLCNASPVLATFSGVPQIIYKTGYPYRLLALAPEDGRLLWAQSVSGIYTTPMPSGEFLVGPEQSRVWKVSLSGESWAATAIWTSPEFRTQWTQPVVRDGFIYGICLGALKCVRLSDGVVQWSTNGFGQGSVILAGSRLVAVAESGWVHLVNADPQAFELLYKCQPLTNNCFNLPAVVDGLIYVRNEQACVCLAGPPPRLFTELSRQGLASYSLTIRTSDGSGIDSGRVPHIRLQVASKLSTNAGSWVWWSGPYSYTNGTLIYTNLPSPTRFFRVCEVP